MQGGLIRLDLRSTLPKKRMQGMALEADLNQGVLLLMSMGTLPLRIRNSFKRTFNGFPEIPEGLLPDAEILVLKEQSKFMKAFT